MRGRSLTPGLHRTIGAIRTIAPHTRSVNPKDAAPFEFFAGSFRRAPTAIVEAQSGCIIVMRAKLLVRTCADSAVDGVSSVPSVRNTDVFYLPDIGHTALGAQAIALFHQSIEDLIQDELERIVQQSEHMSRRTKLAIYKL